MANNKNLGSAKKDMNFFSEFSASSGQLGSYLSLALVVLLGFLVIGGGIYAVVFFQTSAIRSNITELDTRMKSEEYLSNLAKYTEINDSMSGLNQQYYDVSSLFARINNFDKVDSSYMDTIYSNIPEDISISDFTYSEGSITLAGTCISYYSPLDMIANFSKAKLFTYVGIDKINQIDLSTSGLTPEELLMVKKYNFSIKGSLKANYVVLISKLIDDAAAEPITAVKSQTYGAGEQFNESGVSTYTTEDGTVYTLSRVMINNILVSDTDLTMIRQKDSISGLVASSVDVKLFYVLSTNGGAQ